MSEVIVITSGKGGVGKTTTTANVGTGLAKEGKKVVLIDTDIGLRYLDVVLGLEVEEKELIDRLLKRGQVSGRSDDNLETIQKRLDVYHNQTKPLKDFYQKEKKYRAIQGMGSVDDIFISIKSVISEL